MDFIVTLVAAGPSLADEALATATDHFAPAQPVLAGKAAWFTVTGKPDLATMRALRQKLYKHKTDIFVTPAENRQKRLLIADMDSTIVESETLDELAAYAGLKDKIAAITARAMNGELDFKAALRERVGLLRGLPESTLAETLQRIQLNPGAGKLVGAMRTQGATCVLVSGGFTCFTGPVAALAGFTHHHGNILDIDNGKLAGTVTEPILDKDSKLHFLKSYCAALGLELADTLAIGDGANDLPMLKAAGLGIGYRPKPVVEEQLENCIIHGDLTATLYAQGFEV